MKREILCLIAANATTVLLVQQGVLAQTMPEKPEGYFAHRGTVYAKAGGTICGFKSPSHLEIYRRSKGGRDLSISAISTFKNAGVCPVPRAFFDYKNSGFYSLGDGKFCGFSNPFLQNEYRERFNAPLVGKISTDPARFMKYIGICQTLS